MNGLMDAVLRAGGGSAVEMLGGRFGLPPAATRSALEALLPMVGGGLKSQAQAPGGLEGLLGSVLNPAHNEYGENADVLARPGTTNMGNQVLGSIFGNDRDVSRTIAAQAAQKTGLDVGMLKQMLPVVAMMAAGAMAKNANAGGLGNLIGAAMAGGQTQAPAGGLAGGLGGGLGGLANMLDMNKDGNPLDDIMGLLGRR
jgi:hypothetical protein